MQHLSDVRPKTQLGNLPKCGEPHWGLAILGGTMTVLGLSLLGLAFLASRHAVFAFIGIGLSIAGPILCSFAFLDTFRLPIGAVARRGMLIPGVVIGLVGAACLVLPVTSGGIESFTPANVFVWIGLGLALGGGGYCAIASTVERQVAVDRL